jgi:Holliday junction resolvase
MGENKRTYLPYLKRRGFKMERALAQKLFKLGFAVIRGPASGAKVKKTIYPDVVAIYKRNILVFEVKSVKEPRTLEVRREQVEKIEEFAKRADGKSFIAIRVKSLRKWIIVPTEKIHRRDGPKFTIPKSEVENGMDLLLYAKRILSS